MGTGLHRRIATAVISAVVLCTSGIITAGAAHAEGDLASVPRCGESPTSWANRWAVYSGFRSIGGDVGVGLRTELTVQKEWDDKSQSYGLTVTAVEANWEWDPAHAADSAFYDKAKLTPNTESKDGTYGAVAVGHYKKFGEHATTATFTITPHCAADGSVDSLSVRQRNSPEGTVWIAELKRAGVAAV